MNTIRLRSTKIACSLALLAVATWAAESRAQYGTILSGAGPVNRGFAGVATAAPVSAAGALYWNPATLSGFKQSELEAGAELLMTDTTLGSTVPPSAFGPGVPPITLSGRQATDTTVAALPTIGLAYTPEGSDLSFGLGAFAVAGFGVDYAGSSTNPLLTAPPPNGLGFGPVYSELAVLQIVPAVAYRLGKGLSVSAAPVLNIATLRVDPGIFAAPDDANGDGFATYPRASHGNTVLGAGFLVGVYYQADTWAVGASFKSPQWFNTFRFNSTDELNRRRNLQFHLDLPLIVSVGAAYTGIDRWVFAADVRWIDYAGTDGFNDSGFAPNGAVKGLGWNSIFTAALGVQYKLTDSITLRGGYAYGENPIPAGLSFFNSVAPTIIEHQASLGATINVTEQFSMSLAYVHGFDNSITGPVVLPTGAVPGTAVRNSANFNSILFGATVKFGGCGSRTPCEAGPEFTCLKQ